MFAVVALAVTVAVDAVAAAVAVNAVSNSTEWRIRNLIREQILSKTAVLHDCL